MRVAVAVEGCPMGDSRVIDHKALSALGDHIPVLLNWEQVGWAEKFERDTNGVIWLEIDLFHDFVPVLNFEKYHYAHISVGQCLWDQADETTILTSGVIYNVIVTTDPTPWDVINHRAV